MRVLVLLRMGANWAVRIEFQTAAANRFADRAS
jgi:hypothetical protein